MGTRPGLKSLIQFLQSLANMTSAGLPVERALVTVGRESRDLKIRRAASVAHDEIVGGASLTGALRVTRAFPPFMIGMIEVAEEAGVLDDILKELADYYEWKLSMRRSILRGAAYPIIMTPIALVLVGVFMGIMDRVFGGGSLSGFIRIVGTIGGIAGAMVFAIVLLRSGLRDFIGKFPDIGRFGRSIPVFGQLFAKLTVGNFTHALYLCVRAGVPIIQALERSGVASGSATVEAAAMSASDSVREGLTLRDALEKTRVFPRTFLEVIQVAEESGKLEQRLERLAKQLQEETRFAIDVAVKVGSLLLYLVVAAGMGALIVMGYAKLWGQMDNLLQN